jgi:hypothetical protein
MKRVIPVKAFTAIAVVLVLVLSTGIQPVTAAIVTGIPFMTTSCVTFTQPFSATSLTILEFNAASTAAISNESLDIDFPIFAGGIVAGPARGPAAIDGGVIGKGGSANVVPFGPVNLALPSIAQKTDDIATCQRTYFFTDTF